VFIVVDPFTGHHQARPYRATCQRHVSTFSRRARRFGLPIAGEQVHAHVQLAQYRTGFAFAALFIARVASIAAKQAGQLFVPSIIGRLKDCRGEMGGIDTDVHGITP
jgi:hypothetical protein